MAKISLRMFVLGIIFSLALWAIVAHLLAMPVIPPPEQVLLRLVQKFTDVIAVHAGYSLMRIVLGLAAAVAVIPAETYAPLRVLGASFAQIVRHIIVPASLPKFITAVRVAMATAISVLFFTETFGTQYGIGYYIMDAWLRVNYLDMYAGIVVLSTMGLLLFALLDWAERRLCAWNPS